LSRWEKTNREMLGDFWEQEWDNEEVADCSYLFLQPDYVDTGLFTDIGVPLGPAGSPLPRDIWQRIYDLAVAFSIFNDQYLWNVPAGSKWQELLELHRPIWKPLDVTGIEIVKDLAKLIETPVCYRSVYGDGDLWRSWYADIDDERNKTRL
jgi:hypothetical protein